jgi:hypothetical protein
MTKEFSRKLIEVEIRLGFLSVPSKGTELMPEEKTKVDVFLGEGETTLSLSYNPDHKRLFGLTAWYKKHDAKPKDEVVVSMLKERPPTYRFVFNKAKAAEDLRAKEKEAKELIDLSGLSSTSKGDIVEDRIKELILLYGQGLLNVYKPVSDTEGIDLIVVKSGMFQPIFLQAKGRFSLHRDRIIIADISLKTFNPHHSYYVVIAYFNPSTLEIDDYILFIPTERIKGNAVIVNTKYGQRYRVTTQLRPQSKSKWAEYLIRKSDLANKLIEKFEEMARYIR